MKTRFLFAAAAIASAAVSSFAQVAAVGGEFGYADPFQGTLTREQVRKDLEAFHANPVNADGTIFVGGEEGAQIRAPQIRGARVEAVRTEAEKRQFALDYPA